MLLHILMHVSTYIIFNRSRLQTKLFKYTCRILCKKLKRETHLKFITIILERCSLFGKRVNVGNILQNTN